MDRDGHTSSLGITYAVLGDQYPFFFFFFRSGIFKQDLAPTELTAILKTTMDHERERMFFSTQRFRLLSTNAWYLPLSVSINSFIVAPVIVDTPPSILNRIGLDAARKRSCIFRPTYIISIDSHPCRSFEGGIHVVAEGRIGLADELDARAMLEATGGE